MIIGIGKEAIISNIYDEDNVLRRRIKFKLELILKEFNKGQIYCVGKYKNGISMDFCSICADMDILSEVIIPYEDNDIAWPMPIKTKFQHILDRAKKIKVLNNGGFNPKKIKDMDVYVNKTSDIIIDISIDRNYEKITVVKKHEHKISQSLVY